MYYRLFEELELNVQNFSHLLKILVACLSYRYANIHIHRFVAAHDKYASLAQFKCSIGKPKSVINFIINKYYIYNSFVG